MNANFRGRGRSREQWLYEGKSDQTQPLLLYVWWSSSPSHACQGCDLRQSMLLLNFPLVVFPFSLFGLWILGWRDVVYLFHNCICAWRQSLPCLNGDRWEYGFSPAVTHSRTLSTVPVLFPLKAPMCFLNTQILSRLFGWYIRLFAFLCSACSATKQVKKGITSFYSIPSTEQPCKKLTFFTKENKPSPNVLRILLLENILLSAIFSDIQNLNIKAPSQRPLWWYQRQPWEQGCVVFTS